MRVVTCDDTGLVKSVWVEKGQVVSTWRKQGRTKAPQRMCFAADSDTTVYSGLANQRLEKLDLQSSEPEELGPAKCNAFAGLAATRERLVACDRSGQVYFHDMKDPDKIVLDFKAHDGVNQMRLGLRHNNLFAVGGENCDLRIWDSNSTKKPIFKAKNVKHNHLSMQVPVNIRDLRFVPNTDDKVVVTVSAHKYFRMYDARVKTRPVVNKIASDTALNCVAITHDGRKAIIGDAHGRVSLFDIRQRRVIGGFHGPVGAVRGIALHPQLDVAAVVGLDRHLRVYDTTTRAPLAQVFLKQRVEHVLFTSEGPVEPKKEEQAEKEGGVKKEEEGVGVRAGGDDTDDAMWAALAAANQPAKKAKREMKEEEQGGDDQGEEDGADVVEIKKEADA